MCLPWEGGDGVLVGVQCRGQVGRLMAQQTIAHLGQQNKLIHFSLSTI